MHNGHVQKYIALIIYVTTPRSPSEISAQDVETKKKRSQKLRIFLV
jgi:hypothetical protein